MKLRRVLWGGDSLWGISGKLRPAEPKDTQARVPQGEGHCGPNLQQGLHPSHLPGHGPKTQWETVLPSNFAQKNQSWGRVLATAEMTRSRS